MTKSLVFPFFLTVHVLVMYSVVDRAVVQRASVSLATFL
jgi:hypothetical protein